jgi:hypothetical protein
VEIHGAARCSRDKNFLNLDGNVHYLVDAGIGGWFIGTIQVEGGLCSAFEPLLGEQIARTVRRQHLDGHYAVKLRVGLASPLLMNVCARSSLR